MKKSILLAAFAAMLITACGPATPPPTESPTSAPTTAPTTQTPTTAAPTQTPTTAAPTEAPTSAPTETPTSAPTTEVPVAPELPEISETPEDGTKRIYFLAEPFWAKYNTSIFTDEIDYPGESMYLYEEIGDYKVYAYDIAETTTSIGFVAHTGDAFPCTPISFIDVVMDTEEINTKDMGENNLIALNEDEEDTSRSLYIYSDTYVPGKTDYERPERPTEPETPDTPENKTRIYFMDRDWWNYEDAKTSFYYWSSTTDSGEYAFPGITARKLETIETDMDTVVNVWYADIDTTVYDCILFNRVSSDNIEGALATGTLNAQTADFKISDMGENNMIILSHDEFVYDSNTKCKTMLGVYEEGKWDYGQFETGPVVIEPLPEIVSVYYANPNAWAEVYIYAWNNGGSSNATWPGELMTYDETTSLWKYDLDSTLTGIVFNDGGEGEANQKTNDISMMGYSEDKPLWNGSRWASLDGSDDPVTPPITGETYTVYFENNWKWPDASIYTWDAEENIVASWPGTKLTNKVATTEEGNDIYEIEIPADSVGMIFNGTGEYGFEQSADVTDIKDGYVYYMTYDAETNTKPCGSYLYNSSTDPETPTDPEEPETPTDPEEPETPADGSYTLYFYNYQKWSKVNAYVWNEGGSPKVAWPGEAATLLDGRSDGLVYSYTVDKQYDYIIFNDGGSNQTADLTMPSADDTNNCYYPVSTTWGEIPAEGYEDVFEGGSYTVYFKTTEWTNVNIYYWGGATAGWPGTAMTKDVNDSTLFYIEFPENVVFANVIFNNGSAQTADIVFSGWSAATPCYDHATNSWVALA